MSNLEIAKQTLKKKNLTLAIAKNGKIIFQSNSHGVVSLFEAIEQLGSNLEGAAVADRIVGKAVALLCVYSRVNAVFASTLSLEGKNTLKRNGIKYQYEALVPKILDRTRKDICPFERLSLNLENPTEAYFKLKEFAEKLRRGI